MQELITLTRAQKVPLVFVNLPLTDIYLDPARRRYEQTFRRYKQHLADQGLLTFYDLGQQWPHRYEYFADPSHLNQVGAQVVAQDLGNRLAEYLEKRLGVPPLMLDEPAITRVSSE
jgi:poly-D-alanine transfer protein DltD